MRSINSTNRSLSQGGCNASFGSSEESPPLVQSVICPQSVQRIKEPERLSRGSRIVAEAITKLPQQTFNLMSYTIEKQSSNRQSFDDQCKPLGVLVLTDDQKQFQIQNYSSEEMTDFDEHSGGGVPHIQMEHRTFSNTKSVSGISDINSQDLK